MKQPNATFVSVLFAALAVSSTLADDAPATQPSSPPKLTIVSAASKARAAAMLGKVGSLVGQWDLVKENGKVADHAGSIVFAKTSGGTAVREIMLPGTKFEMTNLYHMNGPDMVCTHYCAAGNQPRMICTDPAADGTSFTFRLESATNVVDESQSVMAELTLKVSADGQTLIEDWRNLEGGEIKGHEVFELKRHVEASPAPTAAPTAKP